MKDELHIDKLASLSPTDRQLVMKYLLGGAGIGASVASLVTLRNQLQDVVDNGIKERAKDDHVLKLRLPGAPPKTQEELDKPASVGGALALSGAAVAGLGTYAVMRQVMQELKKRKLQKQLDAAQNQVLQLSQTEADAVNKDASAEDRKPMGLLEALTASPIALSILLGLGSAAATNHFLNKSYPTVRRPQNIGPKRVVLDLPEGESEGPDPLEKEAAAMEFVGRLVIAGMDKQADNDLLNLVGACGSGRLDEVEHAFRTQDADVAFDMIKGASLDVGPGDAQWEAGLQLATTSPVLRPIAHTLIAAENLEMAPDMYTRAAEMPEEASDLLRKVAAFAGIEGRKEFFEKSGSMDTWRDADVQKFARYIKMPAFA
jgi:hypothetical protein